MEGGAVRMSGGGAMSPFDLRTLTVMPDELAGTVEDMAREGWRVILMEKHGRSPKSVKYISLVFAKSDAPFAVVRRGGCDEQSL